MLSRSITRRRNTSEAATAVMSRSRVSHATNRAVAAPSNQSLGDSSSQRVLSAPDRLLREALPSLGLAVLLAYLALTPLPPFAADVYGSLVRRYVVLGVVLIGYLVWLLHARRLPRRSALDLPLAAVTAAVLVAVARSPDPRASLEAVLPLLPAVVLFYLLHDTVLDAASLARAVVLAAAVVAVFALGTVWRTWFDWWELARAVEDGLNRVTLVPPTTPRIKGVGNHPNILGTVFAMALPAAMLLWAESGQRRERALVAIASVLLLAALFFTLSRAAWSGAVAGVIVTGAGLAAAGAGRPRLPRTGWLLLVFAVAAALLLLAWLLLSGGRPDWLFRESLDPRADMRRAGWAMFRDHPLLGIGPGLFVALYPLYDGAYPFAAVHTHNALVQTAVDGGLVGLLAAAWLVGAVLLLVVRGFRHGTVAQRRGLAVAAGMLAALAVHGLADAPQLFPEVELMALVALVLLTRAAATPRDDAVPRHALGWLPRWRLGPLGRMFALAGPLLAVTLALALPLLWFVTSRAHQPYDESIAHAQNRRWPEAVVSARRSAERDPRMAAGWFQLGAAHSSAAIDGDRRAEQREAVRALQRGLELESHNGAALVNYAALNVALDRPDLARATLPALARLAGRDSLLLLAHATLTQWTSPPEQAIETYAGLLVINPSLAATPFWRDNGFRSANFDRIVDRALARVPELTGDGPAADSLRTSIQVYTGRAAPSAEALQRALSARPDDVGLRVATGRLLMASDTTRLQALEVLQGAVRLKGDDRAARAALGDWYARDGDLARARREWTKAAYLGDMAAVVALGNSYPPQEVPEPVHAQAKRLLRTAEVDRFYLVFQTFRFTFQRAEPVPIILPGDWLLALPNELPAWKASVERWR